MKPIQNAKDMKQQLYRDCQYQRYNNVKVIKRQLLKDCQYESHKIHANVIKQTENV